MLLLWASLQPGCETILLMSDTSGSWDGLGCVCMQRCTGAKSGTATCSPPGCSRETQSALQATVLAPGAAEKQDPSCCNRTAAGRQLGSPGPANLQQSRTDLSRTDQCLHSLQQALAAQSCGQQQAAQPLTSLQSSPCGLSGHGACAHTSAAHCLQSQACRWGPVCVPPGAHSALPQGL